MLQLNFPLKDEPENHIERIIVAGLSPCAVVIRPAAIECRVSRILQPQLDVLDGPVGRVGDEAAELRVASRAPADVGLREKQRIGGAGGPKAPER